MIASNPDSGCEQAKGYYYEYLCGQARQGIPTKIAVHIDKCRSCQAEVSRLKGILAEGEVGSAGRTTSVLTTNLKCHFTHLGASVGCETVKLFLPGMAIPALEVSIPTPITVHLDKCRQCASDLETIRQLKLTANQFVRLGQLFAEESKVDTKACSEAQHAIASVGAMSFKGSSAAILKHLCVCPECRKSLYECRREKIEKLSENLKQSPIRCDSISAADIFDYVIPYGIDPDRKPDVKVNKSLTSHLINCPRCLGKMQELHDTVYNIWQRHESGIVTCFKVNESAGDNTIGSIDEMYEDWPIIVQSIDISRENDSIKAKNTGVEVPHRAKRRLSVPRTKPFIKVAAAAAAVILVSLLFFNAPAAKAVDFGQISKALEQIRNVYFAAFEAGRVEPIQEIWVSRALNIKMLKNEKECYLYDIKNKSSRLKDLNTGSITMSGLDGAILLNVKESMEGRLGLLPINSMTEGAQWLPVDEGDIDIRIAGAKVYDLVWTDKSLRGSVIHRKWRGYIDIETKLPKRIEWSLKLAEDQDYKLETTTTISYPTVVEIQARINEAGF